MLEIARKSHKNIVDTNKNLLYNYLVLLGGLYETEEK